MSIKDIRKRHYPGRVYDVKAEVINQMGRDIHELLEFIDAYFHEPDDVKDMPEGKNPWK